MIVHPTSQGWQYRGAFGLDTLPVETTTLPPINVIVHRDATPLPIVPVIGGLAALYFLFLR